MDAFAAASPHDRGIAPRRTWKLPGGSQWLLLALASGLVYSVTAWAALALLTSSARIAIFWPASGLAAGLAIALGTRSYSAIGAGTLAATAAVNLGFGRDPALALGFGMLNAAEAIAVARLVRLVLERRRAFREVIRVLALYGAAAVATGVAALGAAVLIKLLGHAPTPWWEIWRTWLIADFVGIAVAAPLVVAAVDLVRAPVRGHDWTPDIALLLVFAALSHHALSLRFDDGTWATIAPGAALLPILIWLSARSQPIVPGLAIVFLAGLMTIFAAAGIGRYGDPRVPIETRVAAAQVALSAVSIAALTISALYAGRRRAEARLKASELRLAAIAETAPGVLFSLEWPPEGRPNFTFVSAASDLLLGIGPKALADDPELLLSRLATSDRLALFQALAVADPGPGSARLELALRADASGPAWIEINARVVPDANGRLVWHGFIQDVTMRRRMLEEIGHRTRNLLGVVQSVAEHTARRSPPDALADTLGERLSGLAASHNLLVSHGWEGVRIEPLAKSQLAHLEDLAKGRLTIEGPELVLRPEAAQIIGMAIHELSTNACKHGALSVGSGNVRLLWADPGSGRTGQFRMSWEETGGPAFIDGDGHGFGRTLLTDMAAYQLGAEATLEGRADGLIWRLAAPARNVLLAGAGIIPGQSKIAVTPIQQRAVPERLA